MSGAYGELRGRNALVTGGTSGIGRACVERLRGEGMTVSFTGRDAGRAARVEEQTGASFLPADARDRLAVADAVAGAAARADGRLDVVVANAGILFGGPLEQTPTEVFDELVAVNLTAVFATARAAFPTMRAQGRGSLVLIASDAGIRGVHELPAYSATKAGVVALSELLAAEGAPHGVRANAVCPGDVAPGVQATPAGHPEHAEDPHAGHCRRPAVSGRARTSRRSSPGWPRTSRRT